MKNRYIIALMKNRALRSNIKLCVSVVLALVGSIGVFISLVLIYTCGPQWWYGLILSTLIAFLNFEGTLLDIVFPD